MVRSLASLLVLVPLLACPPAADLDAGPAEGCNTSDDCGGSGIEDCVPPARTSFARSPCGACLTAEDECTTDTDCGSGFACRPEGPCGCGQTTLICITGCQDDDECLPGQTCDEDAHCVATSCADDVDCQDNFSCTGGTCERSPCEESADCSMGGECVEGLCYSERGTCFENVPVP